MTLTRKPGPESTPLARASRRLGRPAGGALPGVAGLRLGPVVFAQAKAAQIPAAKGNALIVIGDGHDSIKQGVRLKSRKYFRQAALKTFAAHTKGYNVTLRFVKSAKHMKSLIEGGTWDRVVYFGHGVTNQQALAPEERGAILTKKDLVEALKAAKTKQVFLYGCRAGWTGLARSLSDELPGATVHGTFPSLDVAWKQGKKDGKFYNYFEMKAPLLEYTDGYQTKDGKRTNTRRTEMGDPIDLSGDPLGERVRQ